MLFAQKSEKQFRRNFTVESKPQLQIRNEFGNIELKNWDRNEIAFFIEITVEGGSEERTAAFLEAIEIVFSENPNGISAITKVPKQNTSWWKSVFNFTKKNLNFNINYTVQLPKSTSVDLHNEFGDILIDTLEGNAFLQCEFGNLTVGRLENEKNTIHLEFSSKSEIDHWNGGNIRAEFSNLSLGYAKQLDLKAEYSNTNIDRVQTLFIENEYGSLDAKEVNRLTGKAEFSKTKIDRVNGAIDLELEFGKFKVNEIQPPTQKVVLDTEFTGIQLGIDPLWEFSFDVFTEFTRLNTNLPLNYTMKRKEDNEHFYQGTHLKGSNLLQIKAEFGNLKLNPSN